MGAPVRPSSVLAATLRGRAPCDSAPGPGAGSGEGMARGGNGKEAGGPKRGAIFKYYACIGGAGRWWPGAVDREGFLVAGGTDPGPDRGIRGKEKGH